MRKRIYRSKYKIERKKYPSDKEQKTLGPKNKIERSKKRSNKIQEAKIKLSSFVESRKNTSEVLRTFNELCQIKKYNNINVNDGVKI